MNTFVRECNNFGNFVRILFTCRGKFVEEDGYQYEGQWKGCQKHGQGTLTWAGGDKYKGEWKDGKQHGQGILTMTDGDEYKGEWKGGQEHGQGTYTWADGGKYEGAWKDGCIYIATATGKLKEYNQHPTLVFRSTNLSRDKRPLLYEKDKFLPNGKEIDVKVVQNSKEMLRELQSYFDECKKTHDKTLETFRIVISQHGGQDGWNDIGINAQTAEKILKLIAENGVTKLIISDGSCYGAMKHAFSDKLLAEYVGQGKLKSVKIHCAQDDRGCMGALKGDGDIYTTATLGTDGKAKPRIRKTFEITDDGKMKKKVDNIYFSRQSSIKRYPQTTLISQ